MPKQPARRPPRRAVVKRKEEPAPDRRLVDVLGSLSVLGAYPIPGGQAEEFLANGEGDTEEFRQSVNRFLQTVAADGAERLAPMLITVGKLLLDAESSVLTQPIPNPVIGEADEMVPTHPGLRTAWREVERWTSKAILRGWSQTKRERVPFWFTRSCLELARRFVATTGEELTEGVAVGFLRREGWDGWADMLPRLPEEKVWLKLPELEWTRHPNMPRSQFVQEVLGCLAKEIISQVNLEASNEYLAEAAGEPRPAKRARSRGLKPESRTERVLACRMFGLQGHKVPGEPREWRERCERAGERLGFLRAKS